MLAAWVLLLGVSQLAVGWFWLRTLTLAIPCVAVVTASGLAERRLLPSQEANGERKASLRWLRWRPGLSYDPRLLLFVLLAVATAWPGLVLGVAGPNQATWTTGLTAGSDFLWAWKHVGDTRARLFNVF